MFCLIIVWHYLKRILWMMYSLYWTKCNRENSIWAKSLLHFFITWPRGRQSINFTAKKENTLFSVHFPYLNKKFIDFPISEVLKDSILFCSSCNIQAHKKMKWKLCGFCLFCFVLFFFFSCWNSPNVRKAYANRESYWFRKHQPAKYMCSSFEGLTCL